MLNNAFLLLAGAPDCPGQLERAAHSLSFSNSFCLSPTPWCRLYLQQDTPFVEIRSGNPERWGMALGFPDFKRFGNRLDRTPLSRWSDAHLASLSGDHLLLVLDSASGTLLLANDLFGIRLLYEREMDGLTAWSNRIDALNALAPSPGISRTGVYEFMSQGMFLRRTTLLRSIDRAEPATATLCKQGRLSRRNYWKMRFTGELRPGPELVEAYADTLARAVAPLDQVADKSICLSGGLDSRVMAALLHHHGQDFTPLSMTFRGMDASPRIVRSLSRAMGREPMLLDIDADSTFPNWSRSLAESQGAIQVNHLHFAGCMDRMEALGGTLVSSYLTDYLIRGITHQLASPDDDNEKTFQKMAGLYSKVDDTMLSSILGPEAIQWVQDVYLAKCRELWDHLHHTNTVAIRCQYAMHAGGGSWVSFGNFRCLERLFQVRTPLLNRDFLFLVDRTDLSALRNLSLYRDILKLLFPQALHIPQNHTLLPPTAPVRPAWLANRLARVATHASRRLSRLLKGRFMHHLYDDYPLYGEWIRGIPRWRDHFSGLLLRSDAGWRAHLNESVVEDYLGDYLAYERHDDGLLYGVISLEHACDLYG